MYKKSLSIVALVSLTMSPVICSESITPREKIPASAEWQALVTTLAIGVGAYCIYKAYTLKPLHVFFKQGALQESIEYIAGDVVRVKHQYTNQGTLTIAEHDDNIVLVEAYMHGVGELNPIVKGSSEGMYISTECIEYRAGYEKIDFVITVPRGVNVVEEAASYYTTCSSENSCCSASGCR